MVTSTNQQLGPIWLKASIIGSLWASNEIIIGSFPHNMRVPFSGTILSSIFWSRLSKGNLWDLEGLMAGIRMNLRAAIILIGFSNLYQSLRLSFEALPGLISLTPPAEIGGHGWAGSIDLLITGSSTPQLWSVRKSLVEKASGKWNISEYVIYEARKDKAEEIVSQILT